MGLGGYLIWTTVARELRKKFQNQVLLMPVELHQGSFYKIVISEVFDNNPDIFIQNRNPPNHGQFILPLILNNPEVNYCKKDTPEKAHHRGDKHMSEQICDFYGIKNPSLRCELYLTKEEIEYGNSFKSLKMGNRPFVAIEPYSKTNYTPNRKYSIEKWQKIVDALKDRIDFVQLGNSSLDLQGVTSLNNKTSFRKTVSVLGQAELFLSTEGGLAHAATAVDTKSVVILTGYQAKEMVSYPQNINIDISSHGPCGLKIECPKCKQDVKDHDWKEIVRIVERELCL